MVAIDRIVEFGVLTGKYLWKNRYDSSVPSLQPTQEAYRALREEIPAIPEEPPRHVIPAIVSLRDLPVEPHVGENVVEALYIAGEVQGQILAAEESSSGCVGWKNQSVRSRKRYAAETYLRFCQEPLRSVAGNIPFVDELVNSFESLVEQTGVDQGSRNSASRF